MTTRLMCVLGLLLCSPVAIFAQGKDGKLTELKWSLEHYRFYTLQGHPAVPANLQAVEMLGQFDEKPVARKVQQLLFLGVPSKKNDEPIRDRHAHLGWYALDTKDQQQTSRAVTATNQWGEHSFVATDLVGMLVPSEKIEEGSQFPKQLDHYAVYNIHSIKYPPGKPAYIDTADQFGVHKECDIRVAIHFAVPILKKHGATTTKIVNPRDHLLIYLASDRTRLSLERSVKNQFHPEATQLLPKSLYYFAVPTRKDAWKPIVPK